MKSALSSKVHEGKLRVVERLELKDPKTRDLVGILNKLGLSGKTLIVTGEAQEAVYLSGRNIPRVGVIEADRLNVYDILNMEMVLLTQDAVEKISEVLSA
jgi:large subunit ribosomal protein L4